MHPKKRYRYNEQSIEYLPNELLIQIFSYLTNVDIIYSFTGLNQRFQLLTLNCYDKFDFQSINKKQFDYVIRMNEIHQCQSLRLSNDNQTPGQIIYFFQLFSIVKYFSQLKSLTMINMTPQTTSMIFPKLTIFSCLVYLSIETICGKYLFIPQLPALKHLVIKSCMHTQWMRTLNLINLEHKIEYNCTHEHDLIWPKTIQTLKIYLSKLGDNEIVRLSLRQLSQLTSLAVFDSVGKNSPPNGQIWEELITSFMPLLKQFHFAFKFWKDFNLNSNIKRIMSTFSTSFYLEEKSWFTQCDFCYQPLSVAFLYSLPYAFQQFYIITHSFDESITNIISPMIKNIHKNIRTIEVDVKCQKIDQKLISGYITNLSLKFSGIPMDWIYSMTNLRQLSVDNYVIMSSKDFIRLFENAHKLDTLILSYNTLASFTDQWKNRQACCLLSQRIRSLNILCLSSSSNDYIKVDQLVHLIRIFHYRCFILRNMRHLQSLHVRLQEHNNDMMITKQWLIEQNSDYKQLDCCVTVNRNVYSFWFGSR